MLIDRQKIIDTRTVSGLRVINFATSISGENHDEQRFENKCIFLSRQEVSYHSIVF